MSRAMQSNANPAIGSALACHSNPVNAAVAADVRIILMEATRDGVEHNERNDETADDHAETNKAARGEDWFVHEPYVMQEANHG